MMLRSSSRVLKDDDYLFIIANQHQKLNMLRNCFACLVQFCKFFAPKGHSQNVL